MAGLKPTVPKQLEAMDVKIYSCVDNDDKGKKFEADNNFTRAKFAVDMLDGAGLKDWNDLLKSEIKNQKSRIGERFYSRH